MLRQARSARQTLTPKSTMPSALGPNQEYISPGASVRNRLPGSEVLLVDKSFLSREDAEAFVAGKKVPAPADEEEKYYAVAVGRQPGIYRHWDDASLAIKGWKGPKYKKFGTRKEAREFILKYGTEEAQLQVAAEDGEPPAKKSKKSTSKSVPVLNEPDVEYIYTDGSSLGNGAHGAVAGVGVYFGEGDPRYMTRLKPMYGDIPR
ncbi:hypothetical protein F4778DRAFT_461685 [Xylariomycetidae sp. FL2044]|nr:hypothetical protein F4778DRAFT_461685 [Xylariomycetidae sp. FL2044]